MCIIYVVPELTGTDHNLTERGILMEPMGYHPPWDYPGLSTEQGMKKYKEKLKKEKEEKRKKGMIRVGDLKIVLPGETQEEAEFRWKMIEDFDPRHY
jgi:hypothetical protein